MDNIVFIEVIGTIWTEHISLFPLLDEPYALSDDPNTSYYCDNTGKVYAKVVMKLPLKHYYIRKEMLSPLIAQTSDYIEKSILGLTIALQASELKYHKIERNGKCYYVNEEYYCFALSKNHVFFSVDPLYSLLLFYNGTEQPRSLEDVLHSVLAYNMVGIRFEDYGDYTDINFDLNCSNVTSVVRAYVIDQPDYENNNEYSIRLLGSIHAAIKELQSLNLLSDKLE